MKNNFDLDSDHQIKNFVDKIYLEVRIFIKL